MTQPSSPPRENTGRNALLIVLVLIFAVYFSEKRNENANNTHNVANFAQSEVTDISTLSADAVAAPRRISDTPATAGVLTIPFSPIITTDAVNSIYIDPQGKLWVATESGLSKIEGNLKTDYSQENGLLHSPQAQCLAHDGKNLWIGTLYGLFKMKQNGRIEKVHEFSEVSSELIWDLNWDGKTLWIATQHGLVFRDHDNFELVNRSVTNGGLRNNQIKQILGFSSWLVAAHDTGLSLWNMNFPAANPAAWKNIDHARAGLVRPVNCLAFDGKNLWTGTPGGAMMLTTSVDKLFSEQGSSFIVFSRLHGLPSNNSRAIIAHRSGLWIGTNAGLAKISENIIQLVKPSSGRLASNIRTMTSSGDILWIGSDEGLQFVNMAGRQ